jgi:hypothetical protein
MATETPGRVVPSAAVACMILSLAQASAPAIAAEHLRFESARFQLGALQARLARERGETPDAFRPIS